MDDGANLEDSAKLMEAFAAAISNRLDQSDDKVKTLISRLEHRLTRLESAVDTSDGYLSNVELYEGKALTLSAVGGAVSPVAERRNEELASPRGEDAEDEVSRP